MIEYRTSLDESRRLAYKLMCELQRTSKIAKEMTIDGYKEVSVASKMSDKIFDSLDETLSKFDLGVEDGIIKV